MPIKQLIPNLRLHRTSRRSLILRLIAGIFLRPRLWLCPRNHTPTTIVILTPSTIVILSGAKNPLICTCPCGCFCSIPTLHRALGIHIRHKHQPLRIRRPDRPIRSARHTRHLYRRANLARRLIPRCHVYLVLRGHRDPHTIRREPPIRLPTPIRHLSLATAVSRLRNDN